jgi:hypothetical protein
MKSKMNEVILKISQTHDIFQADKFNSALTNSGLSFYLVCSNNEAVIHGQSV